MSNNSFFVPDDVTSSIGSGMSAGRIELPFTAVYLWWNSGQADRPAETSPVRHFGGWAADADDADAAGKALDGFKRETWTSKEGDKYDVYCRRSIAVAPIAKRFRFFEGRGHIHILAMLATLTEGIYKPWGPVVLSAKGYAGMSLEEALSTFNKDTAKVRGQYANNLASYFFYCPLGTFGDERHTAMAGKKGQQSPYTPVQAWLPKEVTEATLKKWFVGQEIAKEMARLRNEAREWLEAWKEAPRAAAPDDNSGGSFFVANDNWGETAPL